LNKLKEARKNVGLTAEQAAELLGIGRTYLSQIEDGYRNVSADKAVRIAKMYGTQIFDIFEPVRFKPLVTSQLDEKK
jgi:transcriptional regulator with XRE-family HTH domain